MNQSEQKELYFRIGREEGVTDAGLERFWSIKEGLEQYGIGGDVRTEAELRLSFRLNREFMDESVNIPFNLPVLAAQLIGDITNEKGGEEIYGKGIGIQGFGRVSGSC